MKRTIFYCNLLTVLFMFLLQHNSFASKDTLGVNEKQQTIMLISGAFVTSEGWADWKQYFEERGFRVVVPDWPYKVGKVAELRKQFKDTAPQGYDLKGIVDYHAALIDKMPEKPILIGHSFGGLITQLLLQRDKALAGVAYHSVPPKGVLVTKPSFLKALWGPLGIFRGIDQPFLMSFKQWQFAFTNGMPEAEQRMYYEKLVVPETRRVLRAPLKKQGKINFSKPHVPLLFVSGSTDNIIPASLNRKNFRKYKKHQPEGTVTELKEFEGRNHLSMSQSTWREDADFILQWIRANVH